MITFTKSYKTSGGQVFGTIEEAQAHEIETLFGQEASCLSTLPSVSKFILKNKDKMVDILTTTPNSKPKARAVNGGSKKRVAKVVITDADRTITPTTADLTAHAR